MSNFGGDSPKEHSCIIISKSMNWFRRRSHLKGFFSIFSSGGHLNHRRNGLSNVERQSPKEHSSEIVKLFQNLSTDLAEEVVKSLFLFIALRAT